MTSNERTLLLAVARLLAKLVMWKNIDGRNEALDTLKLADAVEAERGQTPAGVPVPDGETFPPTPTDGVR